MSEIFGLTWPQLIIAGHCLSHVTTPVFCRLFGYGRVSELKNTEFAAEIIGRTIWAALLAFVLSMGGFWL